MHSKFSALFGLWQSVAMHPIVSALALALLFTSSFAYGMAFRLGSAIFGVLGKHDLLLDAAGRMLLPALFLAACVRLFIAFQLQWLKEFNWNRVLVGIATVQIALLSLFLLVTSDPKVVFAYASEIWFEAFGCCVAIAFAQARPKAGILLLLVFLLIGAFSLGRGRIEALRSSRPDAQITFTEGVPLDVVIVASSAHGLAYFSSVRTIVHFAPWDRVKHVTSVSSLNGANAVQQRNRRMLVFRYYFCKIAIFAPFHLGSDECLRPAD